jgi:serine/threonine protein kinase
MITLNRQDVVHRDLKPANILLTKDNKIKLADFGLARETTEDALLQTHVGTPYYKAPEIYHQLGYSENVDLWSLGVMLFQMVAGELPFKAMTEVELFNKIRAGSYSLPAGIIISQPCKDLISRLIQEMPERRMNYEQFRKHPFVSLEPAEYLIYLERFQQSLNSASNIHLTKVRVEEAKAEDQAVPELEECKVRPQDQVNLVR